MGCLPASLCIVPSPPTLVVTLVPVVYLNATPATCALLLLQLMWVTFGAVWDLRRAGAITPLQEEVLYLCADFLAKVRRRTGAATAASQWYVLGCTPLCHLYVMNVKG